jgi:hypothetical protein
LLTLDERKAALGIAATDTSKDTSITALGGYVDATITRACKVTVAGDIPPNLRLEPVTETFRVMTRSEAVFLSRRPIVEVAGVSEGGVLLVEDADYEIDGQGIYRLRSGSRTCWGGDAWVTYASRLPMSTVVVDRRRWDIVPEDLKYAAIKFTQAEWAAGSRVRLKSIGSRACPTRLLGGPDVDSVSRPVMDILAAGGYVNSWAWMKWRAGRDRGARPRLMLDGQDIVLRHVTGSTATGEHGRDCRAFVRGFRRRV